MGEITYPRTDGSVLAPSRRWQAVRRPDGFLAVLPGKPGEPAQAFRFGTAPRYGYGWQMVRVGCRTRAAARLRPDSLRREGARLERMGGPRRLWGPLRAGCVPDGFREIPLPEVSVDPAGPRVPDVVLVPEYDEATVTWFTEVLTSAELTASGWSAHLLPLPLGTLILCPGDVVKVEAEGPFHLWTWW